jgi:hypothetical protein
VSEPSEVSGRTIAANFASFLADGKNFRQEPPPALKPILQFCANRSTRQVSRENRPKQIRALRRLAGKISSQFFENGQHRAIRRASFFQSEFDRSDALLAVSGQNVLFGGEIIKKRSFADVGGLGDVFDGSFKVAALRKDLEGGAIDALASLQPASLTPIGLRKSCSATIGTNGTRRFHFTTGSQ